MIKNRNYSKNKRPTGKIIIKRMKYIVVVCWYRERNKAKGKSFQFVAKVEKGFEKKV